MSGQRRNNIARFLAAAGLACLFVACSSAPQLVTWEFTGGPSAQNITTVHVDSRNSTHLLAGLSTGEVYSTTDGGGSWVRSGAIPVRARIHQLVEHPDNLQQLFAASDSGLFVSANSGKDWSELAIEPEATVRRVRSLTIEPYNTSVMYTGLSGRGLYKSTDGGKNWKLARNGVDSLSFENTDVRDIVIDPTRPDRVYAAIRGVGIVRSTDGGTTWMRVSAIIGSGGVSPTSIAINKKSPLTLCYGMEAGNIYRSTDGGDTWSPSRLGSGSDRPVYLVSHPDDPEKLYAGAENDVLMSTDFGTTWKSIAAGLPHVATRIAVAPGRPDPVLIAYGEGIGLARSTNDGTLWNTVNARIGGSTVRSFAGNRSGSVVYASVGTSVHRWNGQLRVWKPASDGLAGGAITALGVEADSGATIYAATVTGVFGSSDGGGSWSSRSPQLRSRSISQIAAHPVFKTRLLVESNKELLVSTDNGASWNAAKPIDDRRRVHSFTFSNRDAGVVLGATEDGVIISSNGGLSWERNRYGLEGSEIAGITLDANDKQTLYAWSVAGRGFRSTDRGLVWDRYTPPWSSAQPAIVVSDHYDPSNVVALAEAERLYFSPSGGATWFVIPTTPLDGEVSSAYWNSATSTIYVGIRDVGVFRASLAEYLKKLFAGG